jgi:hypothetical protein
MEGDAVPSYRRIKRAHQMCKEFSMLRLRSFASVTGAAVATAVVVAVAVATTTNADPALLVGDYATGDFSQWPTVQVINYNDSGKDYVPSYSASIVQDPARGNVARFEVRSGDVPPFGGGERAEVQGDSSSTGGAEGQTRWYRFSTKFDPSFPMNHADLGWGVTNQWHQGSSVGSPPVSWTVDKKDGYWSLTIEKQSAPGVFLQSFSIFDTPLSVGQWHDVMMEIHWSTSDEEGWIKLWHNGVRQTLANGADTYFGRTLIPGAPTVYYKEGMYRQPTAATDVVFHTGFSSFDSEPS